ILGSRLPQAVTALLAGAALAVSGLMMQTMFRNPLAGPSILGISSGANLGVALVMLLMGSTVTIGSLAMSGYVSIIIGAFAGSILIMGVLILLSSVLRNDLMLIITGVLIGYLTSSVITLLNYSASAHGVQGYIMWGMGSFNSVSTDQLPVFAMIVAIGLALSMMLVKPLNALLLGDDYARSLGIPIKAVRNLLLLATGILTAVTTAFCGPVAFIGLAVPHIARMIWRTDNHRVLMPATMLTGSAVALLCCIISVLPSAGIAPINAVTPIIGVPVILYVVIRRK
ncbi:MAG: iron ABC transporter permease, partial [Muribaculaceae bacterium]|nr:iron ABC transporter permease [Muribaculaceae bacterium]